MVCCQHLVIFTHNKTLSKKVVISNIFQEFFKSKTSLCVCMHTRILIRFEVFLKEKGRKAHHKLITRLQNSTTYKRA